MTVDHAIEPGAGGSAASILRVKCSDDQARALTAILGRQYPGRHHPSFPLIGSSYTHGFEVRDSVEGLQRRWPSIEIQLLLGPGKRREAPASLTPVSAPASAKPSPVIQAAPQCESPSPAALLLAELDYLRVLAAPQRIERLERLYDAADESTLEAGLLLAGSLEELQSFDAAAELYDRLLEHSPPESRESLQAGRLRSLLGSGRCRQVIAEVPPDHQSHEHRACLGIALYSSGDELGALPHLEYGWAAPSVRRAALALPLARLYWRLGRCHDAAGPYSMVMHAAPRDLDLAEYAAADFAAIAGLAKSGELEQIGDDRVLDCILAYCSRATPEERATEDSHEIVLHALDLGRRLADGQRLALAYHQAVDDMLQRRHGPGLVEIVAEARIDYHLHLLSTGQLFDILDELGDSLTDYPQLLRRPLIEAYEDLLCSALDASGGSEAQLSEETRDLYRSLYDLDRRNAICERYRQFLAPKVAGITGQREERPAPANIAGKRIAIIGGHENTRMHVRARLQSWGARVDEVAPPASGRISEREILDRVRWSDLILLIVTYMGHDMSTIVGNLAARKKLAGQVIAVDCRGTSGVTRAIAHWAEAG